MSFSEFSMPSIIWHKVRGVVMTVAMKTISVGIDKSDTNNPPNIYAYMGYMFCSVTCLFGPWISFKDYISIRHVTNQVCTIIITCYTFITNGIKTQHFLI